jgi:hypothetical protein
MKPNFSLSSILKPVTVALISIAGLATASVASPYRLDEVAGVLAVIGEGRPPLKVQHKAQARLMAERAAVLDAYGRAARVLSETIPQTPPEQEGYSGFLRGGRIARSELMPDGSVKVELEIPLSLELVGRVREVMQQPDGVMTDKGETIGLRHADFIARHRVAGPRPITLREWIDRYRSGTWMEQQ